MTKAAPPPTPKAPKLTPIERAQRLSDDELIEVLRVEISNPDRYYWAKVRKPILAEATVRLLDKQSLIEELHRRLTEEEERKLSLMSRVRELELKLKELGI